MDALFPPLIRPDRAASYTKDDFVLADVGDGSLAVTFTPKADEDLEIYLPTRGLVFYLPAGRQTVLPGGPSPIPSTDALAIQVLSSNEILAQAASLPEPPAPFGAWWIVEGVEPPPADLGAPGADDHSFLRFVTGNFDTSALASTMGHGTWSALRAALMAGGAAVPFFYRDNAGSDLAAPVAIGRLVGTAGTPVTVRLSAYYAWEAEPTQYSSLPPSNGLSSLAVLNDTLRAHPLVVKTAEGLLAGDLSFYVSFQRWSAFELPAPTETAKGAYERLPAGTVVRLMRVAIADPDNRTEVARGAINASGLVEFTSGATGPQSISRAALTLGAGEAHAFLVELPGTFVTQYQRDGAPRAPAGAFGWRTGGSTVWPAIWMSHGFLSPLGESGTLTGLAALPATSLGLPFTPSVFNVGIPVFLQILYPRLRCVARVYSTSDERAPKGVKVTIRTSANVDLGEFRTDEHGQVWGLLTRWDPHDTDIRVIVHYEMEDRPPSDGYYPLGLPRITGQVDLNDGSPVLDHFDSSWEDPGAMVAGATFGFAGPFAGASLGAPDGDALATALEAVRLGAISISVTAAGGANNSTYDVSSARVGARTVRWRGEHGGLMHAFKTIRHAHEWWYQLTDSVEDLIANPANPVEVQWKRRWGTLFDSLHRAAPAPPVLRVVVTPNPDVTIRGGAGVIAEGGIDLFQLTLLYPETWHAGQTDVTGAVLASENLTLLWDRATVHHEFAHIVLMAGSELYGANAAARAQAEAVYDRGYDALTIEPDTFTPLVEGLANVLNLAITGNHAGVAVATQAGGTAKIVLQRLVGGGVQGALLNAGHPTTGDTRLGLWVPAALAGSLWQHLSTAPHALLPVPDTDTTDLKDTAGAVASILDPDVRTLFQRLVWLPIRALRVPDVPANPAIPNDVDRWNDRAGSVQYPTTFSFIQHLATGPDAYPALVAAEKQRVRDIFGTGLAGAWHLWNAWPP